MAVTSYYVTTDAMGSAASIIDDEGTAIERRSYDAFGKMNCLMPDGTKFESSTTGVDAGFQGQIMDEVTRLYQMGFRWYNHSLGRWLSPDPTGTESGANLTMFVANNPAANSDNFGLQYAAGISQGIASPGLPATSLQSMEILDFISKIQGVKRAVAAARMAECTYMHQRYDAYDCRKCRSLTTTKEEACERAKCFAQEVALRQKYVDMRCDSYLRDSILSIGGSEGQQAGHIKQIADKTEALIR
jgi:RHS repeat-associated protein